MKEIEYFSSPQQPIEAEGAGREVKTTSFSTSVVSSSTGHTKVELLFIIFKNLTVGTPLVADITCPT